MKLKQMFFKGKRVFVEVDEAGELLLDSGRARMHYREDDEKVYTPWPANLSATADVPGDVIAAASLGAKTAAKKKKSPATSPMLFEVPASGTVVAFTDGGCIGNPGPSGLGYVIALPDGTRVQKGEPLGPGTNNIAELTAILRVVERLAEMNYDKSTKVSIYTDSTYAIGVLTMNWKPKVNGDLIAGIRKALKQFDVSLHKVKGHAGHPENELVDKLANGAARTQQLQ